MLDEIFRRRVATVAAVVPELEAYRQWLRDRHDGSPRDYLFTEKRSRFEPRREDVVVAVGALSVSERKGTTLVRCAEPAIAIPVPEVSVKEARAVVEAIDGERCLLEVQLDAGVAPVVLARMLRATFGRVLLAPDAVEALERRVSGVEVARFPGPPYQLERAHWQNVADVREAVGSAVPRGDELLGWLSELHVTMLMGRRLDSFYKPASPGADVTVAPGALFLEPVRLKEGRQQHLFLSGPRVNAKLIGGEGYHAALYRSVGDEEALTRSTPLEAAGHDWGRVVLARSERELEPGPWFCPPRPLTSGHFAALGAELEAALAGGEGAVRAAAAWHWCFVRLHPFHCGNQSLAMSLVNEALRRAGGVGIPHLVLDHFALRLRRDAYCTLFERAVKAFTVTGEPSARLGALMERNARSYAFINALATSGDLDECVGRDPEGARFALLT